MTEGFYDALLDDDVEELYENAPCGYLSTTPDGYIIKVNQTFLRWTGLRVVPERMEFWYGAAFRLHERWLYEGDLTDTWSKRMLYP